MPPLTAGLANKGIKMLSVKDFVYQSIEKGEAVRVKFENYSTPVIHLFYSIGPIKSYRVSHDTFGTAQELVETNKWDKIDDTLHTSTWMRQAI